MWAKIARFIIRKRIVLITLLVLFTSFMAYHATKVEMSYDFYQVIPESDEEYQHYSVFREQFGDDGNAFILGFKSTNLFDKRFFSDYYRITEYISRMEGVKNVLALSNISNLIKNTPERKFDIQPVVKNIPHNQEEMDSLKRLINALPFYKNLIYNPENNATLMLVELEESLLRSHERIYLMNEIIGKMDAFGRFHNVDVHYSGLPYTRSVISEKLATEIKLFSLFAVLVAAALMLIFFRSFYAVIFPLIVISIILIWTLGSIVLFGYKITIITALLPPLIVIIGIPNFIYFLNKYHQEYHKHGNKMKAITRMVEKIGIVTFLTNVTTAIGFGVLYFTNSPVLKEFGLVASLNILATFLVSLIVIPAVFSFLPAPGVQQTSYLNHRWMTRLLDTINHWVHHKRKVVYITCTIVFLLLGSGLFKLQALGFMLDDIPQKDKLYTDLLFFEENFNGVMPLEITVDSRQANGLLRPDNLKKIEQLQDSLAGYGEFSRSISIVDFVKFSRQAFYDGNETRYGLPENRERNFLMPYLTGVNNQNSTVRSLVDSNRQVARISVKMEDVGSVKLKVIRDELSALIPVIFDTANYNVQLTGISVVFLKNNKYLINSLIQSLALAFILVCIIMGLLFGKFRMVIISILPNFIPLLCTAGIMGHFGIPLKPSTVLVFSIAFGISVDDALHFLAKYRQELLSHAWDIEKTITVALHETGKSMIYTSIVLFAGFSIFYASSFGGTAMLGLLTSLTLIIAMSTNLILLPSLLLSFDRKKKITIPPPTVSSLKKKSQEVG